MQSKATNPNGSVTPVCTWCEGSGRMYDTRCFHQTGGCSCDSYDMPCADCDGTGLSMDAGELELSKLRALRNRLEQLARRAVGS